MKTETTIILKDKGEKVAVEKQYPTILPIILIAVGVIQSVIGLVLAIEIEDVSLLLIGVLFAVVGFVLTPYCVIRLVVTNKRVIVDGPFHRRSSVLFERISGVSVVGRGLHISAMGTQIHLPGVPEVDEVYDVLAAMLIQMQTETPDVPKVVQAPTRPQPPKAPVRPAPAPAPKATPKAEPKPVPTPKKAEVDVTAYLGKKWCSGCGAVLDTEAVECSCGSKYLSSITRANAETIVANLLHENDTEEKKPIPNVCPVCQCELVPYELAGVMMCPSCGRTFG